MTNGRLGLDADTLLTTTRAVRRRLDLDRPVPPAVIDECLGIALQAPSGSNMQSWHFVVVQDPETRSQVAGVYRRAFADYASRQATAVGPQTADRRRRSEQGRVFDSASYLADNLHRVPCLVIPIAEGRCTRLSTAHRQAIFWGSIIPAAWSFMLAARERGLGTSWTTMHLRYEEEVASVLGIPFDRFTQAALIPVAYSLGTSFKPGPRRSLDDVVHRDYW
ncbi:nitroreductase [Nocardioides sp. Root1257]|uniref:nitroreductase family protein n=1 Tax=unclassified Nocardioides TaxID=2615069 RepID=UPI0006F2C43E|nr:MULTISPECIES: nitroreductase family protein [unclassified Nocardioides]KQW44993.1 nitroreductase [Nocardioides sp. Root1257]KRC46003.1 nitroreductase [Nocardioides sp. Root224]